MTDPFATPPDAADRPAVPTVIVPRARPRTGATLLKWWVISTIVLVLACIACLAISLNQLDFSPLNIVVDDDDVGGGVTIDGLHGGVRILLATGAVLVALLLFLIVPMLVLLVVGAVALALVAGLGMPLVALAIALVVVSSPLWLIGVAVWLMVRRRPSPARNGSATMAA